MAFWNSRGGVRHNTRSFVGAQGGRLLDDWHVTKKSINELLKSSLSKLRANSRDLELNNENVRSALRISENNIIGRGIPFQVQAKTDLPEEIQESVNSGIEDKFYHWTRKDSADVRGISSYTQIQKLSVRRLFIDGEFIVQMVHRRMGRSAVPFALKIIDPDLLDENLNMTLKNGHVIKMGVELNTDDRPVAYHFKQKSEESRSYQHVRVPEKDIIHVYDAERPDQVRGYPKTNAAMFKLHQLKGLEEATIVGKRTKASVTAFIKTMDPELLTDAEISGSAGAEDVTNLAPGKVFRLPHNTDIVTPNLGDPGSDSESLMTYFKRSFFALFGVSYESGSGDFSKNTYSGTRQAMVAERDSWRIYQDFIIMAFHEIVYERWLQQGVLSGALNIPNYYDYPEEYKSVQWLPRGWSWVDPVKDVNASVTAINHNLKTHSSALAETGEDFRDTVKQIAFERAYMKKYGVKTLNPNSKEDDDEQDKDEEDSK